MTSSPGAHARPGLIAGYIAGDTLPADTAWALEAHLETCARCRQRVAEEVAAHTPAVDALLDRVWAGVDAAATDSPAPVPSPLLRRLRTWAPPSQLPWLLMSLLVTLAAVGIDLISQSGRVPSVVLLVSPVVPLLGVAAAWTRRLDPMGELTVATPRAGLQLVLRRTIAVLVVMLPVLALAGWISGVWLAMCLVPCLAFTAGALALGTVFGVGRAALSLGALWVLAVIVPSLLTAQPSVLLTPASLPAWGLAVAVAAAVLAVRARAFTSLPGTGLV